METADLGTFTEPVLICGGAYGNLQSLEALAELQLSLGISDARVIHSGDAVAYCADTEGSVRFMAARGWHAIKGNVEEQIVVGGADCGCGYAEGSACDAASVRWYAHALATLSAGSRQWMADLPAQLAFSVGGVSARVVHGSVRQTNRFMFASLPDTEFERELDATGADLVIAGHVGIPFTRFIGNHCWHNSGALGMPANDGTSRIWASVLTPQPGGVSLTHHAIGFDAHTAATRIRTQGLPYGYADSLETGLWPSLDVLPEHERTTTGQALPLDGRTFLMAGRSSIAAE
ncbi:metallophosphoesterase family protein [Anderseniella sp. Alg231-50]|uniref:metallophosphoesterase family protein n=1 Tax=Anderseniella sp. Alg231-50 TaxID=1922226 RepID=UPI00307C510F